MTAINTVLQTVTLGETQRFRNLHITPLLAAGVRRAAYLTLDQAQTMGLATVTEVSESGSVPSLLLENSAGQSLFLLDGEELIGAKQNRIVNLTLLVPANSQLEIPVSCVEQGRWRHQGRHFSCAGRTFFSRGRARKAEQVSANLREWGDRYSDQLQVWDDIRYKMEAMNVQSGTRAIADAYQHFSAGVDDYVDAFTTSDTQVGACFAINGSIRGLELFDAGDTCARLMPRLVRGYALDAIEESDGDPAVGEPDVGRFIQQVAAAPVDAFAALGEGLDLRIHSPDLAGGALVVDDRVLHLCAFRHAQADGRSTARQPFPMPTD